MVILVRNLASTFPLTDVPIGSGLTVTVPLSASSRTFAEIVVLIGTPNLLQRNKMKIFILSRREKTKKKLDGRGENCAEA